MRKGFGGVLFIISLLTGTNSETDAMLIRRMKHQGGEGQTRNAISLLESWRRSVVTNEPNKQQWLLAVSIFFSGKFCRALPPGRGKKFHRIAGSRFLLAIQRVRKLAAQLRQKSMMSLSLEGELWVHLLLIFWQTEWFLKWVEFVWSNEILRWEKSF